MKYALKAVIRNAAAFAAIAGLSLFVYTATIPLVVIATQPGSNIDPSLRAYLLNWYCKPSSYVMRVAPDAVRGAFENYAGWWGLQPLRGRASQ